MIPIEPTDAGVRLAVAAVGGLAVGIEREWSARAGEQQRFAGVRTFFLLGLTGGLAAELGAGGNTAVGAVVLASAAAVIVIAYAVSAWKKHVDATTEVSAVVVLAGGFLAGSGRLGLASGLFAITALALAEKSRIHSLVYRIPSVTLTAAARFAVLALVILPILPSGPFGPEPGFRPRELWALVLLFSGLSFGGYVALHAVGPRRGFAVAGLLGGLVSSTLVTLNFSRESRSPGAPADALALGTVGACTVLFVRTAVLVLLLAPALALETARLLALPFLVGVVWTARAVRGGGKADSGAELPGNPLRLLSALQMAIAFQAVLVVVYWATARFGSPGTLVSAGLLGLTDVDALTFSMVKLGEASVETALAARALTLGILSNTLLKLGLALLFGSPSYRRLAGPGLVLLAATTALALTLTL